MPVEQHPSDPTSLEHASARTSTHQRPALQRPLQSTPQRKLRRRQRQTLQSGEAAVRRSRSQEARPSTPQRKLRRRQQRHSDGSGTGSSGTGSRPAHAELFGVKRASPPSSSEPGEQGRPALRSQVTRSAELSGAKRPADRRRQRCKHARPALRSQASRPAALFGATPAARRWRSIDTASASAQVGPALRRREGPAVIRRLGAGRQQGPTRRTTPQGPARKGRPGREAPEGTDWTAGPEGCTRKGRTPTARPSRTVERREGKGSLPRQDAGVHHTVGSQDACVRGAPRSEGFQPTRRQERGATAHRDLGHGVSGRLADLGRRSRNGSTAPIMWGRRSGSADWNDHGPEIARLRT